MFGIVNKYVCLALVSTIHATTNKRMHVFKNLAKQTKHVVIKEETLETITHYKNNDCH